MKRTIVAGALLCLGTGCVDAAATREPANPELTFPKRFLWGTAVAGFQTEAGCPTLAPATCEDRASDWYQWVSDPELIADDSTYVTGEPMAHGPGMRELYAEDFQRARDELHTGAIRLSIEWSRLFPDGAAEAATTVDALAAHADPVAVAYYRDMFATARRLGLKLLVTLNHYTLPLWIHDGKACHADLDSCTDRGWLDGPRITRAIALYAGFCGRTFGDQIDLWATLNEPFATVLAGYVFPSAERSHPPGVVLKIPEAVDVIFHQIDAHARMVDALRAEDHADADGDGQPVRAGTVVNIAICEPKDPDDPASVEAARHMSWLHNELFLEGVARGRLDLNIDGVAETVRPDLEGRLDWIGINYYTKIGVTPLGAPLSADYPWLDFIPDLQGGFFTSYPHGIYEAVQLASRFGVPMIITENGTQASTDPAANDAETFLKPHLRELWRAIDEGMPVEGYFYWTLVDNYEWNHGMDIKMGMYALDLATKVRAMRPIGAAFAAIAKNRGF